MYITHGEYNITHTHTHTHTHKNKNKKKKKKNKPARALPELSASRYSLKMHVKLSETFAVFSCAACSSADDAILCRGGAGWRGSGMHCKAVGGG